MVNAIFLLTVLGKEICRRDDKYTALERLSNRSSQQYQEPRLATARGDLCDNNGRLWSVFARMNLLVEDLQQ